MLSNTTIKKFNRTISKELLIRTSLLNIGNNTEKIDDQKEIQTERLTKKIRIKLPSISHKKVIEKIKTVKRDKKLFDDIISNYSRKIDYHTTMNSYRSISKTKTVNKLLLQYCNYNNGSRNNDKINPYKKYKTINQQIKNKHNLIFVKNNNIKSGKRYKISTVKNSLIIENNQLNTGRYRSCEKKIKKLLKEKSLSQNNILNNYSEYNRVFSNKNDNNSTKSLIFDNNEFKQSKYYKVIQKMEKEILDVYQNKFLNIRKVNVNYLINGENDNINEDNGIKKRIIKCYREFKKNQDNERKSKEQKILDSRKRKIFTSSDNINKKTNFNKFYKYNKNKMSILHLKKVLENISKTINKRLENFKKNLDDDFNSFTNHAYIPYNEVIKIINK